MFFSFQNIRCIFGSIWYHLDDCLCCLLIWTLCCNADAPNRKSWVFLTIIRSNWLIYLLNNSHTMKRIQYFYAKQSVSVLLCLLCCYLFVSWVRYISIIRHFRKNDPWFLLFFNSLHVKLSNLVRDSPIWSMKSTKCSFSPIGICFQLKYNDCCQQLCRIHRSHLSLNALEMFHALENSFEKWV